MNTEHHQPALDGLRAIAVALVVLYHVGIEPLAGGSIGFAIAFVVSGYLLTVPLVARLDRDRPVRWADYLVRRVERIGPALVVSVLGATVVLRWALAPEARVGAGAGYRAGLLLVGNWHLIGETTGPIALDGSVGAAQHLWAVGVLAQFSLLWPVVITALYWAGRRLPGAPEITVRVAIVVLALASAGAAWWLAGDHPARGLYGTDTRAHQFLLGALVAVMPRQVKRFLRRRRLIGAGLSLLAVAALIGLASDLVELGQVQRGTFAALATLVVVAAIDRSDATLTRSLRLDPLPYLGRLAHGTYLWHWPALLVLQELAPDAQRYQLAVVVVPIALGLAALTYELVERPIQSKERFDLSRSAMAASVAVVAMFLGGVVVTPALDAGVRTGPAADQVLVDRFTRVPADLDLDAERQQQAIASVTDQCDDDTIQACSMVEGPGARMVLLGDTMAIPLIPALEDVARAHEASLSTEVLPGCPWQAGVDVPNTVADRNCDTATAELYGRILPELDPDVVVVSSGFLSFLPQVTTYDPDDDLAVEMRSQTLRTLDVIRSIADHVVLVDPMPVAPTNPIACLSDSEWLEDCRFVVDDEGLWIEDYYRDLAEVRRDVVIADLDGLVCPYLPICDPVIAGEVVRLERQNPTQEFGATLAEPIGALLELYGVLETDAG